MSHLIMCSWHTHKHVHCTYLWYRCASAQTNQETKRRKTSKIEKQRKNRENQNAVIEFMFLAILKPEYT